MLAEVEEEVTVEEEEKDMPSLNHSFICAGILQQLHDNKTIIALPELTLDIEKGITPDISVFPKDQIKPNFRRDITKFPQMPILAIEVISASQNIQDLLIKADMMVAHGTKTVWTIEPFTETIFVSSKDGEEKFSSRTLETDGIIVDFKKIFGG